MLNKKSCTLCFQKYEKIWEEEEWENGYISCPYEIIPIYHKGKKITKNCKESIFLKTIFSIRKIKENTPKWCEFKH